MLKVIIKWLEVSFRKCNRQPETPHTNNPICSRDLVPSDRTTCTIASRVNFKFFVPKKNLCQREQIGLESIITKYFTYLLYLQSHQRIPSYYCTSTTCKPQNVNAPARQKKISLYPSFFSSVPQHCQETKMFQTTFVMGSRNKIWSKSEDEALICHSDVAGHILLYIAHRSVLSRNPVLLLF